MWKRSIARRISAPGTLSFLKWQILYFLIHSSIHLFSGGVDSCVKLWNAHAICNPDDEDDEANREK